MVMRYAVKPGILIIFVTLAMILSTFGNTSAQTSASSYGGAWSWGSHDVNINVNQTVNINTTNVPTPASNNAIYNWTLHEVPGPTPWGAMASSMDGTKLVSADYGARIGDLKGGYIYTSTDSGGSWTQQTGAGQRLWNGVASSSDGTKLIATESGGSIYTSADSGCTWKQRTSTGNRNWIMAASSSDGTKLFAVAWADEGGPYITNSIYGSFDSGATWTRLYGYGNSSMVACSSDGTKLIAADSGVYMINGGWEVIGNNYGYIYTSTDSGVTWIQQSSAGLRNWFSIATSSDGTKLFAADANCSGCVCPGGYLYTSSDSGATWNQQTDVGSQYWGAIASSSDGTNLMAIISPIGDMGDSYLYTSTDSGGTWTKQEKAGQRNWWSAGSSADGTKLFATDGGDGIFAGGYIYTSADSGATWVQRTNPSDLTWRSVASSFDATKLVAVVSDGYVYTSADSGGTWTQNNSLAVGWQEVVSSSDGTKLAGIAKAATDGTGDGWIFTSTDSGATWTPRTNAGPRLWQSIASSSDGAKLVAAEAQGYIYTSPDSGDTWIQQARDQQRYWTTVASSSDGTKLVAADNGCYLDCNRGGFIYTSTDSGSTWKQRRSGGSRDWQAVASSSTGAKLIAAELFGHIFTSADFGATWTERTKAGNRNWSAVSSSSDGRILVAAEYDGHIYISVDSGATWKPQLGAFVQKWESLAISSDGSKIAAASGSIWTGTPATQPVIDNPTSTTVAASNATVGATIESDSESSITTAGIAYGTSVGPAISGSRKITTATSGSFTVHLTGLTPNTMYHFRGYATNSAGTTYTDDAQFTTVSGSPRARSASNLNLTSGGFTANWNAPRGSATISNYQLDVATDPRFSASSFVTGYTDRTVSGTSAAVSGLTSGKIYYYRVRAVNAGGTSAHSNSVKVVFGPSKSPPSQPGRPGSFPLPGGSLTITAPVIVGTSSGSSFYSMSGVESTCVNAGAASPYGSIMKVSAGPDQNVSELTLVDLNGSNSIDIDKSGATYLWTQLDGPPVALANPSALETTFIAPEAGAEGPSLRFQLAVTETNGAKSTDDCIVNVVKDTAPPTAVAGPDQTVAWSQIVALDGSRSSVSDAGGVSYSWRQVSGVPESLSDPSAPQPTFVASNIYSSGESLVFELTVTDLAGLRSRDTCIVNVVTGSLPPVAKAGPNQLAQPGSAVVLDGSGSMGEENGIVSYTWRQIAGPPVTLSEPSAIQPSFVAPLIDVEMEDLIFELTVTDSEGLQSKAETAIAVVRGTPVR